MAQVPTLIGFGWSGSDEARMSRAIRYLTRPGWAWRPLARWSHMYLVFGYETGEAEIHEALMSEGWCKKSAGKLHGWLNRAPGQNRACIEWLDVPPETVRQIWEESLGWMGTRSYAWRQIAVLFATHCLLGRALRPLCPWLLSVDVGEDEVICSEGAGRLVGTHYPPLDLRQPGETWAMLSPEDWAVRYGDYQVRRAWLKAALETADHGD